MTTTKPAKVTPTEEQYKFATDLLEYSVDGQDAASMVATRDRDVRRNAWRDAIHAVIAAHRERRLTLEILGKLLSKDPDHAD